MDCEEFAVPFDIRRIGADFHKMGDGAAAAAFGYSLEEFADLEEQHDEHRLRKLRLCSRQKSDRQGAQSCHRHQEVFVECITVGKALSGFFQCVKADYEVWYEIYEKELPVLQVACLLDDDGRDEKDRRNGDLDYGFLQAALFVVMMVMALVVVVVMLVVFMMVLVALMFIMMLVMMFVIVLVMAMITVLFDM